MTAITSRKLEDLDPRVAKLARAHIEACAKVGIELLITSTLRNAEAQTALFAQGRTAPGKIVTNARAGESMHNFGLAYDCVPLVNGKAEWDSKRWPEIGRLGEDVGLEWSGRWSGKMKETAHFQWTNGLSLSDLKAGKRP